MTKAKQSVFRASALAILAGGGGMILSMGFLASTMWEEIIAGTSGFVAGAILFGSGLIAAAMVARSPDKDAASGPSCSGLME
ncbi:MAG TPA: hypothetical protein VF384_03110 [Planctomycetota bacterium]